MKYWATRRDTAFELLGMPPKLEQAMTFRVLTELKLRYRTFDARLLVDGEDIMRIVPRNPVGCRKYSNQSTLTKIRDRDYLP